MQREEEIEPLLGNWEFDSMGTDSREEEENKALTYACQQILRRSKSHEGKFCSPDIKGYAVMAVQGKDA